MKKVIIILLSILIYIASVNYNLSWVRGAYSEEGRLGSLKPNISDLIIVYTPALNLVGSISFLFINNLKDNDKKQSLAEKLILGKE